MPRATPPPDAADFDAFLCYAREDVDQAVALQEGLERLGKPWFRHRAMRVFRDRSELAAGAPLWSTLRQRLSRSRWLVLLAAPESARSSWVSRELDWWLTHRSADRLVIVHTAGELHGSGAGVNLAASDALHEVIFAGVFAEEPTWATLLRPAAGDTPYPQLVDSALGPAGRLVRRLRGRGRPDDASATRVLRDCLVDVASAVRATSKQRLLRRHRLLRGMTAATVAVVLALVAVALVLRDQSDDRYRSAAAARLVERAAVARAADPDLALRLGIAADRIRSGPTTRAGLVATLTSARYRGRLDGAEVSLAPGRPLAATSGPQAVRIWATDTAAPRSPLGAVGVPAGRRPGATAFAPDGTVLAVADETGEVTLHGIADPTRPVRLGAVPTARRQPAGRELPARATLAFTPDGRLLAVGTGDAEPSIWDVADPRRPRPVARLRGHAADVTALAISADGALLATGDAAGVVVVWDIAAPADAHPVGAPLPDVGGAATALAFARGGRVLAAAGTGQPTRLWDLAAPARPRPAGRLAGDGRVAAVAFTGTGVLVSAGAAGIELWSADGRTDPTRIAAFSAGAGEPVPTTIAVAGDLIATGAADAEHSLLWTALDPAEPHVVGTPLVGPADALGSVTLDATGRVAAVIAPGRAVALVDIADPARPRPLGPPVTEDVVVDVAFGPDGGLLATAGDEVTLWNTADPRAPSRLVSIPSDDVAGLSFAAAEVSIAPDGRLLSAVFEDGSLSLWDIARPERPRRLAVPTARAVSETAFAPDGRTLAIGTYTGTVELWDVSDPAAVRSVGRPFGASPRPASVVVSLAFAPDSALLATGFGDETAILWSVRDPAAPAQTGPPLDATSGQTSSAVAFSPSGRLLVTGAFDGGVVIRDVGTPADPVQLGQRVGAFSAGSLAVVGDGRALVAGTTDGIIVLVDLGPLLDLRERAPDRACAITGRGLDADEWDHYLPDIPFEATCAG